MSDELQNADSTAPAQEGRLSRWARRKSEQQHSEQAELRHQTLVDLPDTDEPLAEFSADEPAVEAPVLTDEDMPPVASLGADSDFSGFMSPGVSEQLRKLALRKMFSLASFQQRDGLDDYDDDFTNFEPLGDTVTNDPWTHRQKRLAEEKAAAEKLALEQEQITRDEQHASDESEGEQELAEIESSEQTDSEDASLKAESGQETIESEQQTLDDKKTSEQDSAKHE